VGVEEELNGREKMTLKELDRLVTRTDINDISKKALRHVRTAIEHGRCGSPVIGDAIWRVAFETDSGSPVTMSFSFRKDAK